MCSSRSDSRNLCEFSVHFGCAKGSAMRASLLLASLVTILVIPNGVRLSQIGPIGSGCYLRLHQIASLQGDHYAKNEGSHEWSHQGLKYGRRRLSRFTVRSIALTGPGQTCCFRLHSSERFKGAKRVIFGGQRFNKIRDTGLTTVKSFRRMSERYCTKKSSQVP